MAMQLGQLLAGYIDGDLEASSVPEVTVTGLCLDSRQVGLGDVYFALQGTQTHGIEYAEAAAIQGAVAILVDSDDANRSELATEFQVPVVKVPRLTQAMGTLASRYFDHPSHKMSVCGVTGTDGKTSVCRFIADSLHHLGHKVGYIGTIGWGIDGELAPNSLTTPDAITLQQMLNTLRQQGAEFVALEVSSHALVQGRVNGVAFDVAVLTNLGRDHLDYHRDLERYKAAKAELFAWPDLSALVLNIDDRFGRELALKYAGAIPVCGFSVAPEKSAERTPAQSHGPSLEQPQALDFPGDNKITASDIEVNEFGISFTLDDGHKKCPVKSALLGRFNIENLMSCFGVLRTFGITADDAVRALGQISSVPGRMERFGGSGANVVVDFAHTPQALQAALRTLRSHCAGKLWVVFGCGGDRDPGKRELMGEVAARDADVVVVTDDNPRTESSAHIIQGILKGIPSSTHLMVIADRGQAIEHAVRHAADTDWVLVAGKGHEDYQIVGTQYLAFSDRTKVRLLTASPQPVVRPGPAGVQR